MYRKCIMYYVNVYVYIMVSCDVRRQATYYLTKSENRWQADNMKTQAAITTQTYTYKVNCSNL